MTYFWFVRALTAALALWIVWNNYKEHRSKADLARLVLLSAFALAMLAMAIAGAESPV